MVATLEIVDTAIKVGLGALISGVTTYFVTTRTHSHEIQKSFQNEQKELLKEASIKLERCGSLLNEARQSVYLLVISADPDKETKFHEVSKSFTAAFNYARESRSLCYMIGQRDLAVLITGYCDAISELTVHYQEKRLSYDHDFVEGNTKKLGEMKTEILENFSGALRSIYISSR